MKRSVLAVSVLIAFTAIALAGFLIVNEKTMATHRVCFASLGQSVCESSADAFISALTHVQAAQAFAVFVIGTILFSFALLLVRLLERISISSEYNWLRLTEYKTQAVASCQRSWLTLFEKRDPSRMY